MTLNISVGSVASSDSGHSSGDGSHYPPRGLSPTRVPSTLTSGMSTEQY